LLIILSDAQFSVTKFVRDEAVAFPVREREKSGRRRFKYIWPASRWTSTHQQREILIVIESNGGTPPLTLPNVLQNVSSRFTRPHTPSRR
jgi:hypothetical protein